MNEGNQIVLTPENRYWLEKASDASKVEASALLNAILRQVRGELDTTILEGKEESLSGWLERSQGLHGEALATLEEAKRTLTAVQETGKAIQLYMYQARK